ncbi:uncharacterized protein Dvar_36180 [Desulfosarcina variabilis str. Montpellier]|uniref:hypothetical protein n=1 Tax=Desulfosarcina variabilis TaxID=2300 RepID=UPI003AFB72D9
MEQRKLVFAESVQKQIINYQEASKTESRTAGSQVKLTPTQKQALESICRENGVGVSTFIAQALDCYIELFPYKEKLKRHHDAIITMLNSMA